MTEAELINKLSKRYAAPAFAFLSHVRNQTGYSSSPDSIRTADALALGLWKSRGHHLIGFEIKVSRSDWLHEYKQPEKADAVAKYCDYFYLVVSDKDIVKTEELPRNWGLLAWDGKSVKEIKAPLLIEAETMSRAFLCGFMRKVTEGIAQQYTPTVEVEKTIEERVNHTLEWKVKEAVRNAGQYEDLMEKLRIYQEKSGIPLTSLPRGWEGTPEQMGDAVRFIMDGRIKKLRDQLGWLRNSASSLLDSVDREIKNCPIDMKQE